MKRIVLFIGLFFTLSIQSFFCLAQWNADSTQRNAICTATSLQYEPQICSDGHGGAIMAWADQRNSGNQDIYVQRIDSTGTDRWAANGVQITLPSGAIGVDLPLIVKDNFGGAIVFYQVTVLGGAGNIYAQRLDSNGNFLWNPAGGVPISVLQDSRIRSNEVPATNNAADDGEGGAFITWQVYSPFNNYIQHIDKNGNVLWGANGESLTQTDSTGTRYESYVINTGNGTAVAGYSYYPRLYLQRVNADGSFKWGNFGVLVVDSFYNAGSGQGAFLVYDSVSTARSIMLGWIDTRNSSVNGQDIYAQKLDTNGNLLWQKNGVPVATSTHDEYSPDLLIDKNGGFYITYDSAFNDKIQHVNSSGQLQWGNTGISAVSISGSQTNPVIADDGSGGIIAAWHDNRSGLAYGEALFAQRYNQMGLELWRPNGIPVITKNADLNHSANPMISLEDGNAIICWADLRTGTDDIYAAKIGGTDGFLPVTILSFTGKQQNSQVLLQWKTAREINSNNYTIERSADGTHFSPLLTVAGHGTTSSVSSYNAVDSFPINGNNFYRLKETDIDGLFKYSNVIRIQVTSKPIVTISPNPAVNYFDVAISSAVPRNATIFLSDLNGKTLMEKNIQLTKGNNIITINVNNLSKGIYVLRSTDSDIVQKIIKQ